MGTGDGIVVSQDSKHVDKLVELLGLQKASGKTTPCPMNVNHTKIDSKPLDPERHALYRTCIGILLYLGQDRPESLYTIKQLSECCTCPTESDWSLLRHLVKFLKAHPIQGIKLTPCRPGRTLQQKCRGLDSKVRESKDNAFGEGHLLEAISDASWAGERDKKCMSAMTIFLSGNLIHASNRRQKSVTLSSCESELHGSLAAVQEGIFLKRVLERLCGCEVQLQHRVDSSSCRAVISRQGLSRLRHVEIAYLWIQEKLKAGEFVTGAISTKFCPPDLLTKPTSGSRTKLLCYMLGVVQDGELVGQTEFDEELVRHELKRVAKIESKSTLQAIRQVILSACVFMEARHTAEGHSLTAFHVGSQDVTCLDSIKHMPLMNVEKPSVSVAAILVSLYLLMTLVVCLADLKFLRPPIQRHLRLPSRLLLNVVILILTMTVPVRASESGDQNEEDTFPPEAGYFQSRRKSWQNGFGSTTVINEMVMMLPQPIEATSSWLILVSLMVCVLTAMLTSYWTASTVKDMLKKWPCGEPSSTPTNESDLATEMKDNSEMGAPVMPSPTTSPPRSPRNQRRDQESEAGFEVVDDSAEGGEEREDPQPNPGGDATGPGVDDGVRDRLFEWMEENIAAPLRAQQAPFPTMAQQTPQVLTRPQPIPQAPLAPQQVPQGQNGQRHAQEQVCVFFTGRRYHRLTCGMVRSNPGRVRRLSVAEAVQGGRRPCRQRGPPELG